MSTARQHQLVEAIRCMNAAGVTPTYERLRERLGLASRSGVFRLLELLRDQGRVEWEPHRAGTLRLIEGPSREAMERWPDEEVMRVCGIAYDILADRARREAVTA